MAAAVLLVFSQAGGNAFINFDDDAYILNNAHVSSGLTWDNFAWAWANRDYYYWQPLTWLSHQLDVSLFGLRSGPHHFENALLHAVNATLCFLLLRRFSGSGQAALTGAALWALHPLRVESVAWAAERKDVLSALFCLLATIAYLDRRPAWLPGLYFVLGLMCKPTLVFLPIAFLLLDHWPLKRLSWSAVLEKWPLFLAAALSSLITLQGQTTFGATEMLGSVPLPLRIGHALTNSALYLWRTLVPAGLAIIYPYDMALPVWKPLVAGALVAGITLLVWRWRNRHPSLALGWAWYLIALAPVSGVIQAGGQSGADRFTYIPAMGLMIALLSAWPRVQSPGVVAAIVYGYLSFIQIGYWKDSVTLFTRATAVTENNWVALNNLGAGLIAAGRADEGVTRFQQSLAIRPRQYEVHYHLGSAMAAKNDWTAAQRHYEQAVEMKPDYGSANFALGLALLKTGKEEAAQEAFGRSVTLNLADSFKGAAHYYMGSIADKRGDKAAAERYFRQAERLR